LSRSLGRRDDLILDHLALAIVEIEHGSQLIRFGPSSEASKRAPRSQRPTRRLR
jgi:hypothetical protein